MIYRKTISSKNYDFFLRILELNKSTGRNEELLNSIKNTTYEFRNKAVGARVRAEEAKKLPADEHP